MKPIRQLAKSELKDLTNEYLTKIEIEDVYIRNGGIYKTQLEDLLYTIDQREYIQDAVKFLHSTKFSRESVSYSVNSEKLMGPTRLEVVNNHVRNPSAHGYKINIYRYNVTGKEEIQLTLKISH